MQQRENIDISFKIDRATRDWKVISLGRAHSWVRKHKRAVALLLRLLDRKHPPDQVPKEIPELLNTDPADIEPEEDGPRDLGFIGKQLLPHLRRTLIKDELDCQLLVNRSSDFRYVRLAHDGTQPPPLAYIGQWSHNGDYCAEVESLILWSALKSAENRKVLKRWLDGEQVCVVELPPLSNVRLTLKLKIFNRGEAYKVEGTVTEVLLPNLAWFPDHHSGTLAMVRHLPSLISLLTTSEAVGNGTEVAETEKIRGVRSQLLVASPHVRKAAAQGSDLWRDRSVRSALMIAPPGSGKEVLADFLHTGRVLFRPKHKSDATVYDSDEFSEKDYSLPTIQFSGYGKSGDWRRDLYGELRSDDDGSGDEADQREETEVTVEGKIWRNGLLRRARGTTVFFDEIDKAHDDVRRALLRFLENDDVAPQGGPAFSLGKGEGSDAKPFKCLRLFAGSKPRNTMFELGPPDFWTRIQLVIDMVHPLEIHDRDEKLKCLQEYVLLFLFQSFDPDEAVSAEQKAHLINVQKAINNAENPKHCDLVSLCSPIANTDYPYLYLNAEYARQLSQYVAEFLVWIPSSRLSVRNLKALIKRLDVRIRDWVLYEFDSLDAEVPRFVSSDPIEKDLERLQSKLEGHEAAEEIIRNMKQNLKERRQERHRDRDWIWAHLHHIALEVFDA